MNEPRHALTRAFLLMAVVACLLFARFLFTPGICFPAHTDAFMPWSCDLNPEETTGNPEETTGNPEETTGIRAGMNKTQTDKNFSWHPDNEVISQALRSGRLPLWDRYQMCGFPLLAQSLYGVFYPFNLPLFLGDTSRCYTLLTLLHYLLGGFFTYLLLRKFGLSHGAALLGGVVFMASANLTSRFHFYMTVQPMIWAPLLLLLLIRYHRDRCGYSLAGVAVLHGLILVSGWQQVAVYLQYIYLAFSLFLTARERYRFRVGRGLLMAGIGGLLVYCSTLVVDHPIYPHVAFAGGILLCVALFFLAGQGFFRWLAGTLPVAGALVLGVGLAAVQLAPVIDHMPLSMRHLMFPDALIAMCPPFWAGLTGFLFPTLLSHPIWTLSATPSNLAGTWLAGDAARLIYVENVFYIGLLPLVLAGLAFFRRGVGREARFLSGLCTILILMSFGAAFVIYPLWLIPGFQIGDPKRVLLVLSFIAPLLAAFGYERLRNGEAKTAVRVMGPVLLLAAVLSALVGWFYSQALIDWLAGRVPSSALSPAILQENSAILRASLLHFAGAAGLAGVVLLFLHKRGRLLFAVLMVAILVDLTPLSWLVNFPQEREGFLGPHDSIALMQPRDEEDPFRIFRYTEGSRSGGRIPLPGNMSTHFGIEDAEAYITQPTRRYFNLVNAMQPDPAIGAGAAIWPLSRPEALASPILDLLGVRFLVATREAPEEIGLEEIYNRNGLWVYHNEEAMPRAFLVRKARFFEPEDPAIIAALIAPETDCRTEVMLECPPFDLPDSDAPLPPARVRYPRPEEAVITFDGENPGGLLILVDSFYPGWKAWVDGVETSVYPADLAFRGVSVPPGCKEVVFRFEPRSLTAGLGVSLLAGLGVLFLIIWTYLKKKKG